MWKKYFRVVKLVPGEVVVPGYGTIDFSKDNISVEVCQNLVESDFPYLAITEEGKNFLYGEPVKTTVSKKVKLKSTRIK
jgi:hypothetical protein